MHPDSAFTEGRTGRPQWPHWQLTCALNLKLVASVRFFVGALLVIRAMVPTGRARKNGLVNSWADIDQTPAQKEALEKRQHCEEDRVQVFCRRVWWECLS